MTVMSYVKAIMLATGIVASGGASAQVAARDGRDRTGHLTGFVLAKADSRLQRVPDRLVTGRLDFERAYLGSIAASRVLIPRFTLLGRGNSLEIEGQFAQHFGNQDNAEATAALVLRSGQLGVFGGVSINGAWGNGVSYAFSNPRQERGDGGIRGVDTEKFQYHMSFETEITDASAPDIHLVLRLHHRSGVYGLISSDRTGSNYLGAGLRFDLR